MIVEYAGDEPIALAEVKLHCRVDDDAEDQLFEDVIIPGARAMAEKKTGCAIREAIYRDEVDDLGLAVLSIGGVLEIQQVMAGDVEVSGYTTDNRAGRTVVRAEQHIGQRGTITYRAGTDIAKHPGVKSWILLACGWLYTQRELLHAGQAVQEIPQRYVDTLLSSIDIYAAL